MLDYMKSTFSILLFFIVLFSTGCSLVAPKYTPSIDNVEKLKASSIALVDVSETKVSKNSLNTISLRGSSLNSPYGTYGAYLSEAIKQEFKMAGKFKKDSNISIYAILLENDINTNVAFGEIEALIQVKKSGNVIYSKEHKIHLEWETSFAGAIAIPKAQQQYPIMVQKLLAQLYSDNKFIAAMQ